MAKQTERKQAARWRKAKNPEVGSRWDTPMNRTIWERDHGQDQELWRGGEKLATARPDGSWVVHVPGLPRDRVLGQASDIAAAKVAARKACES
jgi:hypothetical protein